MLLLTSKIKQLREEKGWTQEVLAKASGLSLRTVQRIESTGKASSESTLAISSALDVTAKQLALPSGHIPIRHSRRVIIHNVLAIGVISAAIIMLFVLAGELKYYFDLTVLSFTILFTYAATVISFGTEGFIKSILGLKYLFTNEIKGGDTAKYLVLIYNMQIKSCYGGALIAFLISSVAIHGSHVHVEYLHSSYAVSILLFVYASIFCEAIIRPLKVKLETCDLPS